MSSEVKTKMIVAKDTFVERVKTGLNPSILMTNVPKS